MRKLNAIITALIMVMFILHGVLGSMQMMGISPAVSKTLAWCMTGLIAVHAVIGIKFTIASIMVWKKTGVSYFRENKLFWARRLSGLAIMVFILSHITAFGYTTGGAYRLHLFTAAKLVMQMLLVISIAVHIISNIKPMLISFGIKGLKQYAADILIVISILLLVMAAAFIIYYLRWNAM